jgi:hypothetical protein
MYSKFSSKFTDLWLSNSESSRLSFRALASLSAKICGSVLLWGININPIDIVPSLHQNWLNKLLPFLLLEDSRLHCELTETDAIQAYLFSVAFQDSLNAVFLFEILSPRKLGINTERYFKHIHATFWSNNSRVTDGRFAAFLFKLNRW